MEDWEINADKYSNQIDKIVSQMHEDDFFDSHSISEMMKILEKLREAKTQLSQIYTEQKEVIEGLFEKNGGGADNKKALEWDNELTEINYYCEIARDFIPELEEMLQEKGEEMEEKENPEEVFEGLSDMREPVEGQPEGEKVDLEKEPESQTIDFDKEVAEKYKKEAGEIIVDRETTGKRPTDTAKEGEMMKKNLMNQIGETLNPEEEKAPKAPEVQERDEEREDERQK